MLSNLKYKFFLNFDMFLVDSVSSFLFEIPGLRILNVICRWLVGIAKNSLYMFHIYILSNVILSIEFT
jgi:hypothetical protein